MNSKFITAQMNKFTSAANKIRQSQSQSTFKYMTKKNTLQHDVFEKTKSNKVNNKKSSK